MPATAPIPNQAGPQGPNWTQIETVMHDVSSNLGYSTTFMDRGFIGLIPGMSAYWSCVGAATDRANAIADALQAIADNGGLANYTATVGTRSGYQIMGASFHTYTVVVINDAYGNVVKTYEVDNYFMPTYVAPASSAPNFDTTSSNGNSNVVKKVK